MANPIWRGTTRSYMMMSLMVAIFGLISMSILLANITASESEKMVGGELVWFGITMLIGFLAAIYAFNISVDLDTERAKFSWGFFGFPSRTFKWEQVAEVSLIEVRPTEWGGWGYRWVPWKRGTAAVLRKGPGLRFDFTNGRVFVVTIDDAAAAMKAIQDARRKPHDHSGCNHDH